jgi:hypothetical protein
VVGLCLVFHTTKKALAVMLFPSLWIRFKQLHIDGTKSFRRRVHERKRPDIVFDIEVDEDYVAV